MCKTGTMAFVRLSFPARTHDIIKFENVIPQYAEYILFFVQVVKCRDFSFMERSTITCSMLFIQSDSKE